MRLAFLILLVLTGTALANYESTILVDNPVGYWRLDEASGDFNDSLSAGVCVASGGITYAQTGLITDGSGNTCATFNGTTGKCKVTNAGGGNYPDGASGAGWSIEVWYRTTALPAGGHYAEIASVSDAAFGYAWQLAVLPDGSVQFIAFGGGTSGIACKDGNHASITSTAPVVSINTTYQFVVTTRGRGSYSCGGDTCVAGLDDMRLYVNGFLDNDAAVFNYTDLDHQLCGGTVAKPMYFAYQDFIGDFAGGKIDEISFYQGNPNSQLSPDRVLCHWLAGNGLPCTPTGGERRRVYEMQ